MSYELQLTVLFVICVMVLFCALTFVWMVLRFVWKEFFK